MKRKLFNISRRYQSALRAHLKHGHAKGLESARGLGSQALAAGLQTGDLAKLHEKTLLTVLLAKHSTHRRSEIIKQAGIFFTATITPIEKKSSNALDVTEHLKKFVETLSQRTAELAASNLELSLEIAQRKTVETALKKSQAHYAKLLEQSNHQQEKLRRLSRQILLAQEDERKKISRELHDVIAQNLTSINLRLAELKKEALHNTKGIDQNIARTQRLVEKSVNIIHQFARELRPAVLDDLGLIPALHSFLKSFTSETGIHTRLASFAGVEQLSIIRRTVLYRIAQEALTNVARHAKANRAEIHIRKLSDYIFMTIKDDGKSFQVERVLEAKGSKRLGLLSMKERLEMVGGRFEIKSIPGKGTTVEARIPFGKTKKKVIS